MRRYILRNHFYCRRCHAKTWANELAPKLRQLYCPSCYRAMLNVNGVKP